MGLFGMFSSSKEDVKAKIESKKGDIAQIKARIASAKQEGRKDNVSYFTNRLGEANRDLADLKAKLAKMK